MQLNFSSLRALVTGWARWVPVSGWGAGALRWRARRLGPSLTGRGWTAPPLPGQCKTQAGGCLVSSPDQQEGAALGGLLRPDWGPHASQAGTLWPVPSGCSSLSSKTAAPAPALTQTWPPLPAWCSPAGIGRHTAKALHALGARVVALSRTRANLVSLSEEVRRQPAPPHTLGSASWACWDHRGHGPMPPTVSWDGDGVCGPG